MQPEIPLAHPLDGGYAGVLHRSIDETADGLGADAAAYRALMEPTVRDWEGIVADTMMAPVPRIPRHPRAATRFGLLALRPAARLAALALPDRGGAGAVCGQRRPRHAAARSSPAPPPSRWC